LGDTIGIDLELQGQEQEVGPFRADILCKETIKNTWVLIENQIEKTDHTHLGQILTYGAGLEATTIVWIAKRFTEQHRAALDWLNEITNENFNFFGLEIELWRIGNSQIAPKFNVVCRPKEWTPEHVAPGLTLEKKLLMDYWNVFVDFLREKYTALKIPEARPYDFMSFPIGRTDMFFSTYANPEKKLIGVQIYLKGSAGLAKLHFELLQQERDAIESAIGSQLEWKDHRKKERSIDLINYDVDVQNREYWPKQHQWLYEKLELFYKAFAERVKDYPSKITKSSTYEEAEHV
jgi:hypothetical protein